MKDQCFISIAIADDHVMVRKGIVGILASFPGFSVSIEADDGQELIDKINQCSQIPEVCILDISMPVMNGFETAEALKKKWPDINILVLTAIKDEYAIIRMLRQGAKGYVLKSSHPRELHQALIDLYSGKYYSSELLSNNLLKLVVNGKSYLLPKISTVELRLLKYYCEGKENKEISTLMDVSVRTIEGYRNGLFSRLQVNTKVDLIIFALRTGLVSLDSLA
jgi:two-component system invasion response regulator UvrY